LNENGSGTWNGCYGDACFYCGWENDFCSYFYYD